MSEAYGTVVIKAPKAIVSKICEDDESVPWGVISQLLKVAEVDPAKERMASLFLNENNEFYHEGIQQSDGMAIVSIFGEQWMYLMAALVKQGRNIEAFGNIHHEHGTVGFFALDKDGKTFCQFIDYESDDDPEDKESIREEWQQLLPAAVAPYFEAIGDDEEDWDEDDSQFDDGGWMPIEQCLTETVQAEDNSERLIVNTEIYHHPKYDRSKLQEAIQSGASLVNPSHSVLGAPKELGCSLLNLVITDPEIESYAHRKRVIEDILSLDALDLNEVYCGYDGVGTPLYLAAAEGLYEVVEILINRVEDKNPVHPWRKDGLTALDEVIISRDAAMFCDELGPTEGRDYQKVIDILEQANQ